jgi:hypothetical protein
VDLHALPVIGEYIDDGISGTIPLADRPEGQRLLIDAEAGRFGAVLVYRIDRLGRSLRSLRDRAVRQRDTHRRVPVPTPRLAGRTGEVHDRRAHGPRAQPGGQRWRLHRRANPAWV